MSESSHQTDEESEKSSNYLEQELTRLRELVELKTNENQNLETKLNELELNCQLKIEQLNQDFSSKLEQQLSKFEECQRDKQSSLVMKYAAGEKKCIDLMRSRDHLQSKLNDALKEKEACLERCNKTKLDLTNSQNDVELKCEEILNLKKEVEKLKCSLALSEAREQASQIKDHRTSLIDQKQLDEATRELKSLKSKLNDLEEEKSTLRDRLKCMDEERIRQVNVINENEIKYKNLDSLLSKTLKEKSSLEYEIKLMQNDLNLSQEKQADLLEFTSKLTDKNSQLQTEIQCQNDKLEQLELELNELKTNDLTESFKSKLNSISEKLESEINKSKYLEDDLIRKEKEIEHLNEKLNEQEHELNTMRKKHANNVKDLTKQLQILHKKVQSYEANEKQMNESSPVTPTSTVDDDSKSINSETISTAHCSELICGYNEDFYVVDVDKQKLVEKIVNLQKTLAKQNEKNDFLQDHINLLTVELKKKTK